MSEPAPAYTCPPYRRRSQHTQLMPCVSEGMANTGCLVSRWRWQPDLKLSVEGMSVAWASLGWAAWVVDQRNKCHQGKSGRVAQGAVHGFEAWSCVVRAMASNLCFASSGGRCAEQGTVPDMLPVHAHEGLSKQKKRQLPVDGMVKP